MEGGKGKLLKIFIGESDRYKGEALYHAIIKKIKEQGLAGATTLRGIEGFGAHSKFRSSLIEVLSSDLPIVIEVIDQEEKIKELIKVISPMVTKGLIVMINDIDIIKYVK
jgi:hypothetical protein